MKTLVIRLGERLTIRSIAFPSVEGELDPCPTLIFFQEQAKLRRKEMDKLAALLTETANEGPPKDETKFRKLNGPDDLYEFKTSGGLRLLCFWDEGSLIICTHGYLKGSQQTPKNEIQRAKRLKRDYFEAKQRGEVTHAQPRG